MKGEREEDRNQELSIPPVCYDPQAEGGRLELEYEERIRSLQESVAGLRLSRRILMTLLESVQDEYRGESKKLVEANNRLRAANNRYATALWEKNCRIRELEEKLARISR